MRRRWKIVVVMLVVIGLAVATAHLLTNQRWGPLYEVGYFQGGQPLWSKLLRGRAPSDTGWYVASEHFTDADLRLLKHVDGLIWLNLMDSQVTDAGAADLAALKSLNRVALNRTKFTDAGVERLAELPQLEHLELKGIQLTDAGAAHFKKMKSLKVLHVTHTQLTDAGMLQLTDCANLEFVDLLFVNVTDQGVAELQKARPKLQIRN